MTAIDPEILASDERIVIEPRTVAHEQFLAGRALLRLHEVVPPNVAIRISAYRDKWIIELQDGYGRWLLSVFEGDTIAEAADVCRVEVINAWRTG